MSLRSVEHTLDIPVVSNYASVGSWILFKPGKKYSEFGHSGVVMRLGTSTITVLESNFIAGQISVRTIPINSPDIRGYYYENTFVLGQK